MCRTITKKSYAFGLYSGNLQNRIGNIGNFRKEVSKVLIKDRRKNAKMIYQRQRRRRKRHELTQGYDQQTNSGLAGSESVIAKPELDKLASRIARAAGAGELTAREPGRAISGPLVAFGIKLSTLRRRQGLRLEELAEKANMNADTLFAIELGLASFRQIDQHLHDIGDALDGKYAYLSSLLITLALDE